MDAPAALRVGLIIRDVPLLMQLRLSCAHGALKISRVAWERVMSARRDRLVSRSEALIARRSPEEKTHAVYLR